MRNKDLVEGIADYIQNNFEFGNILGEPIFPKQGMSSLVFFLNFESGLELVIKYGEAVDKDFHFLNILKENNSKLPVPKVYGYFELEGKHILLLEKINGKHFGEVELEDLSKYFETVLENFNELHKIVKEGVEWKKYLQNIFNEGTINWKEVLERKNLEKVLLELSLNKISEKINNLNFKGINFSLLHTDFNQNNLFVESTAFKIVGIVDWEEATFGDSVYDFARFHLHLWHREVSKKEVDDFLKMLNLNEEEKIRERIYFLSFIIHYLAYYSESENDFNFERIKMHQEYLSNVDWELV